MPIFSPLRILKGAIWKLLWLYFIARSLIDLTPFIAQRIQAYALETAKQNAIERLNPFKGQ